MRYKIRFTTTFEGSSTITFEDAEKPAALHFMTLAKPLALQLGLVAGATFILEVQK